MKPALLSLSAALALSLAWAGAVAATPAECAGPGAGGAWPMYGHDLSNTRHQDDAIDVADVGSLAPVWSFSAARAGGAGDFTGTPVVARGCVFVGSNMGWLFAMDEGDGTSVWTVPTPEGGTINNSLAVDGDTVYAYISREGSPYVAAFDASTGATRWTQTVDEQPGSDAFASPVVFDGMVFVGISGDAAQHGDEGERILFHGSYVILDAGDGHQLAKTWTIPESDWDGGYAGGTVTTTPAIDLVAHRAYVGTGSPFRPQLEHPRTDALLKIDIERGSPTFGEILDTYKGDTFDAVVPTYSTLPCSDLPTPTPPALIPTGRGIGACGDVDVDFAASPTLLTLGDGTQVVATSQKSGRFHMVATEDMTEVWTTAIGPAQPFGGVSGAFDGTRLITGAAPPGQLVGLEPASGTIEWVAPVVDGAHYGIPVASGGDVAYTLDVKGFLDGYDAATGLPLLHRPILLGAGADSAAWATFGGVSVAGGRVFASVGAQNTGADALGILDGYVVAFAPEHDL